MFQLGDDQQPTRSQDPRASFDELEVVGYPGGEVSDMDDVE